MITFIAQFGPQFTTVIGTALAGALLSNNTLQLFEKVENNNNNNNSGSSNNNSSNNNSLDPLHYKVFFELSTTIIAL
eukprot:UN10678